jgi:hypothetical protein
MSYSGVGSSADAIPQEPAGTYLGITARQHVPYTGEEYTDGRNYAAITTFSAWKGLFFEGKNFKPGALKPQQIDEDGNVNMADTGGTAIKYLFPTDSPNRYNQIWNQKALYFPKTSESERRAEVSQLTAETVNKFKGTRDQAIDQNHGEYHQREDSLWRCVVTPM